MAENIKTYIWVTTQRTGWHSWINAPDEVGFLSFPHRHIFKFKVYITAKHNDRELEFFLFKKDIDIMINNIWDAHQLFDYKVCQGVSCEMISDDLYDQIKEIYPERDVIIEVSEDGENGSRKEYFN